MVKDKKPNPLPKTMADTAFSGKFNINGSSEDKKIGGYAGIGEQSSQDTCHCEGVKRPSQSHNSEILSIIKPHPYPLLVKERESNPLKRTYRPNALSSYRLKQSPLTLTLSRKGRGKYISVLSRAKVNSQGRGDNIKFPKRTYSPIDLFTYSLKKKAAFTLAEVLITLGIIGVVAAITIPTVVNKYKKIQIETRLKKVYTVMNQAVEMSKAHGTWTEFPSAITNNSVATHPDIIKYLNSALIPYLNGAKFPADVSHPNEALNDLTKLLLADGTLCFIRSHQQIHVYCDINGTKGPNKNGNDIFYFFLDYNITTGSNKRASGMGNFYPAGYFQNLNTDNNTISEGYAYKNRTQMKNHCISEEPDGLTKNYSTCALLIMYDGWQIKDDYPAL